MRRTLDIILAALGLVASLPVLMLVAVSILIADGSPVLFRQTRVGKGASQFTLVKFRTMTNGSGGPAVTHARDARITTLGRLLRKSKLDELPQLVNVLSGRMSLVGPRPDVPSEIYFMPPSLKETVLSVRPGITDDASIHFRNEQELLAASSNPQEFYREVIFEEKLRISSMALEDQSARQYFATILRTLRVVLFPRSACPCMRCRIIVS